MSQALDFLLNYIYGVTGLYFMGDRISFAREVLSERMEELKFSGHKEYLNYLMEDTEKTELGVLIGRLTINETYFFRDYSQLQSFADHVLPKYIDDKEKKGDHKLSVVSAGCSSGDEAYTLAIILSELLEGSNWKVRVDAFDIDCKIVERAQNGIYSSRALRDIPMEYKMKYFLYDGEGYVLDDKIKKMVNVQCGNIMDRKFMRQFKNVDFLFCRNVLIYFDEISQARACSQFYTNIITNGYLFLGHAESASRHSKAFNAEEAGGRINYRKPSVIG